jgi:hemolysin activation/secretion protein
MKYVTSPIALACSLCFVLPGAASAQAITPSPQQSIEQSTQLLRERAQAKPLAQIDMLGLESAAPIAHLVSVQVQGSLLKQDIEHYWKGRLGQSVSTEQLQDFHSWFYEKARREGFMAYAQTQTVDAGQGQSLIVQTLQPKVGTVRILSSDPVLIKAYAALLKRRFEVDFKSGQPLDILGLDQRLDSVGYDLPIELDATLRAVGPEMLDLIVNISPAKKKPGQLLSFIEQWTNYGLRQYGQAQILAMGNVAGLQAKSSLSLLGQISEGIGYARAEYEGLAPEVGRWRVYGARSDSQSILSGLSTTKNFSAEVGAGLTRVLGGHRDMVFKGHVEISRRETLSHLLATGSAVSSITDHQLRLRWTADNERLSAQASRAEMGLTVGDYKHVAGPTLAEGVYMRLDVAGKTQKVLDSTGTVSVIARVKGQWSNRNLDSYNQMALGGVTGVRGYTSIDGVGDRAVLGSLELNKAFRGQWSAGLFYDAGYVQNSVQRIGVQNYNHDTLKSVGLKVQGQGPGQVPGQALDYSLTLAKGVGGYKSWQSTNLESKPNNYRFWAGVTFFFI